MSVICVTGHRKLYGYDLNDPKWILLKIKFKSILNRYHCSEAITGMALGVDTVFALAVLELKNEGYPISLHCAIPCRNQSDRWPVESRSLYHSILKQADKVILVTDAVYTPRLMQIRNEYMVDLSDIVIAVWNGLKSGTANCIEYARRKNKPIYRIVP